MSLELTFLLIIVVIFEVPLIKMVFFPKKESPAKKIRKNQIYIIVSLTFVLVFLFGQSLFGDKFANFFGIDNSNEANSFLSILAFVNSIFIATAIASTQELSNLQSNEETLREIRTYFNSVKPEKVKHIQDALNELELLKKNLDQEDVKIVIPSVNKAINSLKQFFDDDSKIQNK